MASQKEVVIYKHRKSSDNERLVFLWPLVVTDVMELFETILIALQLTGIFAKRFISASDESIENLLYYKDCQHKRKEPSTTPPPPPPPPPPLRTQDTCQCPRMCCSMCCATDCFGSQPMMTMSRQNEMSPIMPPPPLKPVIQPQIKKPLPNKPIPKIQPLKARRNMGSAREKIKLLINHDEDIKKILKDLVSVTMQKVNVGQTRRNEVDGAVEDEEAGDDASDE